MNLLFQLLGTLVLEIIMVVIMVVITVLQFNHLNRGILVVVILGLVDYLEGTGLFGRF